MSTIDNKTLTNGVTLGTSGSYASPLTITSTGAIKPKATVPVSYAAVYASASLAGTVFNNGIITDYSGPSTFGIKLNGDGYVTNTGRINGLAAGVAIAGVGTVVNSGGIGFAALVGSVGVSLASGVVINNKGASAAGISIGNNGTVINAGRIFSETAGALTATGVNTVVINSGTIEGLEANGIVVGGPATIVNSGIISGIVGVGVNGSATIVNSGTIQNNFLNFSAISLTGTSGSTVSDLLVLKHGSTLIPHGTLAAIQGTGAVNVTVELAGYSGSVVTVGYTNLLSGFGAVDLLFGPGGDAILNAGNTSGTLAGTISGFTATSDAIDLTAIGTDGKITGQSATQVTVTGSLGMVAFNLDASDSTNLTTFSDGAGGTDLAVQSAATGSRLAFFAGVSADKINVVLTETGSDVGGKAIAGDFNIEVYTVSPSTTVASGFQASAFIQGAVGLTNNAIQAGRPISVEQLLTGGFTLTDLSGGASQNGSIQVIGQAGEFYQVIGSAGDIITGSSVAGVLQVIDASGTNKNANPGPFLGAETVIGGLAAATVTGGKGSLITGGAGTMQVNDGTGTGGETVKGGAGSLTVFSIGKGFSIVGSTGGTTIVDDTYGGGGGSSIVGGNGSGMVFGANTLIFGEKGDQITVGSAPTVVEIRASSTVTGGFGTLTGALGEPFNTLVDVGGTNDLVNLGRAASFVDTVFFGTATGSTVTGGAGAATVYAGAGTQITGGDGDLLANDFGGANTISGSFGNLTVDLFSTGKKASVTGAKLFGWTAINDGYGGGGSTLVGGSGTVPGAGAAGFSSFIVGGVGDSIAGGAGTTSVNAFIGSMTVGGGAGAMSVQSAKGDVINSGTGTLLAFLNTDQTSQTINLGLGHGLATLQDVTVAGAAVKGSSTVTGFASATDIIGSSNSVDATGKFLGSSASDGAGGTLLTFVDGSTMDLVGIAAGTKLNFLQTKQ